MRFPFEFLHLNEARGIRSRRRRLIYIYIYNPVSNSFARTTVALRPAPVILHPSVSIVFLHFSTQETASLVDLFISSCFALRRLASFSLFIVVYSFPFFARFRSISSSFCSRRLRRCRVDDDVEFSSRLWRRPGAADFRQLAPARGPRVQYSKLSLFLFHGNNFFFSSLPLPSPVFAIVSLFYSLYAFSFPFFPLSDQATLWNNSLSLRLEIVKGR